MRTEIGLEERNKKSETDDAGGRLEKDEESTRGNEIEFNIFWLVEKCKIKKATFLSHVTNQLN